ncbi:unnamed protein product [Calypogeia fissa]
MLCRRAALAFSSSLPIPVTQVRSMHSSVSVWKGLEAWRSAPIDERRVWGTKNSPVVEKEQPFAAGFGGGVEFSSAISRSISTNGKVEPQSLVTGAGGGQELEIADLASWGHLVLVTADPLMKAWLTHQAYCLWTNGKLEIGVASAPDTPGRPDKPELVLPREVPGPKDCSLPPSAHMLHNLAHIELNAIDLAWDTVVRFSHASEELGRHFFADFLHVADDESRHFRWCSQRLAELGYSYGDMPAHNLLWQDCMKTSGNVKFRLAVIPMMQEARGLDAGPRLVKRLLGLDDHRSAAIVRRIGQEEVAHVGVGVFHFLRICEKIGVDPGDEFQEILKECDVHLNGPFNHKAREVAGLRREWYDKSAPTESPDGQQTSHRLGWKGRDREGKEKKTEGASDLLKEPQESSNVHKVDQMDEKPNVALQSSSTQGGLVPDKSNSGSSLLPEVYERLALLVAMEKENAGT